MQRCSGFHILLHFLVLALCAALHNCSRTAGRAFLPITAQVLPEQAANRCAPATPYVWLMYCRLLTCKIHSRDVSLYVHMLSTLVPVQQCFSLKCLAFR